MSGIFSYLRRSAYAFGVLAFTAVAPAHAATIFQTATFTGNDNGDYIVQDGALIGAAFTLSAATQITGIGGQFGPDSDGTIFGAIVPLTSSFPAETSNLASIALGSVVFSVPGNTIADYTASLALTLGPGTYAVIFGSGQFGADGFAGLGDANTPFGSPQLFQSLFDPSWSALSDPGVRIFVEGVEGSETPLPGALPLFAGGLGVFGLLARRRLRRDAVSVNA